MDPGPLKNIERDSTDKKSVYGTWSVRDLGNQGTGKPKKINFLWSDHWGPWAYWSYFFLVFFSSFKKRYFFLYGSAFWVFLSFLQCIIRYWMTVCPGSSDPLYIASLIYKMGHVLPGHTVWIIRNFFLS